jgi:hypothetical protein
MKRWISPGAIASAVVALHRSFVTPLHTATRRCRDSRRRRPGLADLAGKPDRCGQRHRRIAHKTRFFGNVEDHREIADRDLFARRLRTRCTMLMDSRLGTGRDQL